MISRRSFLAGAAATVLAPWPVRAAPDLRCACELSFSGHPLPVTALYAERSNGLHPVEQPLRPGRDAMGRRYAYTEAATPFGYDFNQAPDFIGYEDTSHSNRSASDALRFRFPWLREPETGTRVLNMLAIFRTVSQGSSLRPAIIPDGLDLRGARVDLELLPALTLSPETEIAWHVQSLDPALGGRSNNMVQTCDLICRQLGAPPVSQRTGPVHINPRHPVRVSVPLSTKAADWLLLGARADKTSIYGKSASPSDALQAPLVDMVLMATSPTRPRYPETMVSGTLRLYGFSLWVDAARNPVS
jgi:hypothetical protein